MLNAPMMNETIGAACVTLVEPGAFMESARRDGGCVGASVVVQQPGEESARLLSRMRKSVQALRKTGCRIGSAAFVLGAHQGVRMKSRLVVGRGLLDLLADESCTLHLVASTERNQQFRLFQFVEQLLSGRKQEHPIHITFHEQKFDQNVLKARLRGPEAA